MKGTIIKILAINNSRNNGTYRRVQFKLENNSFAQTDLVPTFRNYNRWLPLLHIGQEIEGLKLMHPGKVDADSYPRAYVTKTSQGYWADGENGGKVWVEPPVKPLPTNTAQPGGQQEKLL